MNTHIVHIPRFANRVVEVRAILVYLASISLQFYRTILHVVFGLLAKKVHLCRFSRSRSGQILKHKMPLWEGDMRGAPRRNTAYRLRDSVCLWCIANTATNLAIAQNIKTIVATDSSKPSGNAPCLQRYYLVAATVPRSKALPIPGMSSLFGKKRVYLTQWFHPLFIRSVMIKHSPRIYAIRYSPMLDDCVSDKLPCMTSNSIHRNHKPVVCQNSLDLTAIIVAKFT